MKSTTAQTTLANQDVLLEACASMGAWLRMNPHATAVNACAEFVSRIETTILKSRPAPTL